MWPFTSKSKAIIRLPVRYGVLEMKLKMGLAHAWSEHTKVVPTEDAYLTTSRAEIIKIANKSWVPWKESAIGGGICEIQCFRVLVGAYDYAVDQKLQGRLAIFAALTAGDNPHAYVIGMTSPTTVVVYDQTAGDFIDESKMDSPIRIIYA